MGISFLNSSLMSAISLRPLMVTPPAMLVTRSPSCRRAVSATPARRRVGWVPGSPQQRTGGGEQEAGHPDHALAPAQLHLGPALEVARVQANVPPYQPHRCALQQDS